MEHNENNIKDMMRGDRQPLPPALEWSNMKDGILSKMNSIEQSEASPADNQNSRKRIWLFLSLFFMVSITGTAGWLMFTQEESAGLEIVEAGKDSRENSTSYQTELLEDGITPPGIDHFIQPTITVDAPTTQEPNRQSSEVQGSSQASQSPEPLTESIRTLLPVTSDSSNTDSRMQSSEVVKSLLSPLTAIPIHDLKVQLPATRDFGLPGSSRSTLTAANSNHEVNHVPLPSIEDSRLQNQFMLESGITFWNEGYGNTNPERAQYEAPIPSFQIQGSYLHGLKGGYFLLGGLQFQQLDSKLEYNNTIEDYPVTLKDTILQVQQNLLTGKETIIRGDAIQTVRAERRVRHYNRTQLLRTSLAFGKAWQFNSFQTDVYLGGAFGAIIGNDGRMFSGDDILDYSGLSTPFYQNRWIVHGIFGARLHYFPYERIGITTGFQAQRSLMNWSSRDEIRFFPTSMSLQLGVSYSL